MGCCSLLGVNTGVINGWMQFYNMVKQKKKKTAVKLWCSLCIKARREVMKWCALTRSQDLSVRIRKWSSRGDAHRSSARAFIQCFALGPRREIFHEISIISWGAMTLTAARSRPMNGGREGGRGGSWSLIQLALYSIRWEKSMSASLSTLVRVLSGGRSAARNNRTVFSRPSGSAKEKLVDVSENKRCSLQMVTQSDRLWLTWNVLLD